MTHKYPLKRWKLGIKNFFSLTFFETLKHAFVEADLVLVQVWTDKQAKLGPKQYNYFYTGNC